MLLRYDGYLDLGHRYKDIEFAAVKALEEVVRRSYNSQGLERLHSENESFSLKSEIISIVP